jgi:hypothetical protein
LTTTKFSAKHIESFAAITIEDRHRGYRIAVDRLALQP